jgi:hypothetical protein
LRAANQTDFFISAIPTAAKNFIVSDCWFMIARENRVSIAERKFSALRKRLVAHFFARIVRKRDESN